MASQIEDPTLNMEFDNTKRTDGNYTKSNPKIEKSCGVIVYRDNGKDGEKVREFLLLKYPEGHWDFPKGHVENDELEMETAKREFTEETGIDELEFIEGFRDYITYEFYANFSNLKGWIKKTVVFFLAETHEYAEAELSHEHHDFDWLTLEEAKNKITYDNAREVFDNAIMFLQEYERN